MINKFNIILFLNLILISIGSLAQSDSTSRVFKMDIKAEIDPRMSRYVNLAFDEAESIEADYVIIEMDTYGGAVDDTKQIMKRILDFKKPVWVFINKDAASAGALISIACDSIYMAPGASMGAATVVVGDGTAAPDKYQSYMRGTIRSAAEEKGRDPQIAEAMIDQSIEIEGVTKAGQVITFSTSEAIKHGFCEGEVSTIDEILEKNGVVNYEMVEYEVSGVESFISIFLNPFVSSILILVIIGGIYFELQTPGVGFPIAAAAIALVLYFVPYYMTGLAENWEIIAFFIGIVLIALEIFVIPGFGVAGILGIIVTTGSLALVMLNNDMFDFTFVELDDILIAIAAVLAGLFGSMILLFVGGVKLTNSKAFQRVALTTTMDRSEGYTSNFYTQVMKGKKGVAHTILRPSGKVLIDDEVYDAYTRGEYIDQGQRIIVTSNEGTSLKVKIDTAE